MEAYDSFVRAGIPKSDAIQIVPRGLKFGVVKTFNLYNLTLGYMSLRLCSSAEPEMKKITGQEAKLVKDSPMISQSTKKIIAPKCHYTGFCHEEKFCGQITKVNPSYTQEFHSAFRKERQEEIAQKVGD